MKSIRIEFDTEFKVDINLELKRVVLINWQHQCVGMDLAAFENLCVQEFKRRKLEEISANSGGKSSPPSQSESSPSTS